MAFFSSVLGGLETEKPVVPAYISQSSNLQGRIGLHITGTVQDSVLREKIALRLGFGILKKLNKKGTVVKTIHTDNSSGSEQEVTDIIKKGQWKLIRPGHEVNLADYQRYLNERLSPVLHEPERPWDKQQENVYSELTRRLTESASLKSSDHEMMPELPGIYVFYHHRLP
ncbi:MAG: hypothetical protein ACKOAR_06400 [Bacteroidota bacterium]